MFSLGAVVSTGHSQVHMHVYTHVNICMLTIHYTLECWTLWNSVPSHAVLFTPSTEDTHPLIVFVLKTYLLIDDVSE